MHTTHDNDNARDVVPAPETTHLDRRRFTTHGAAAMAPLVLSGCSFGASEPSYREAVQDTWRADVPVSQGRGALLGELVRCATLAPSSHNTQCWTFALHDDVVSVLPDLSRRCPAVDPDDHHLFVSLGCATENLAQAAAAHGLQADAAFDATAGGAVRVRLDPTRASASDLFKAIFARQCTRAEFDGQPVSADELKLLERAGTGNGVQLLILSVASVMTRA